MVFFFFFFFIFEFALLLLLYLLSDRARELVANFNLGNIDRREKIFISIIYISVNLM